MIFCTKNNDIHISYLIILLFIFDILTFIYENMLLSVSNIKIILSMEFALVAMIISRSLLLLDFVIKKKARALQ